MIECQWHDAAYKIVRFYLFYWCFNVSNILKNGQTFIDGQP